MQPEDENTRGFGEFRGDGSCLGDGGALLQELWARSRWKQLKNCPGRYACRVKAAAQLRPLQLLRQALGEGVDAEIAVQAAFTAAGKDPITVLRFADGGGLLTYDKGDGVFVHTLNTESGLCRKLIALRVDPFSAATTAQTTDEAAGGEQRKLATAIFRTHLLVLRCLPEDSLNEVAAAICACVGRLLWRSQQDREAA